MFCSNCGKEIDENAVVCPHCGVATANFNKLSVQNSTDREWIIALLLCFFLGGFGAHRFYVGKTGTAICQLVLTLTVVGAIITAVWALVDLILILTKTFKTAEGRPLV